MMIANSGNQPLVEHSLAVCKKALEILSSYKVEPEEIRKDLEYSIFYSALLHDAGKVHKSFQEYINKKSNQKSELTDAEGNRKKFNGPFHNEISFLFATSMRFSSEDRHKIINYSIYWHHPANVNEDNNFNFLGKDSIRDAATITDGDLDKNLTEFKNNCFTKLENIAFFRNYDWIKSNNQISNSTDLPQYTDPNASKELRAKQRLVLYTLIEADREVSSFSIEELDKYLKSESIMPVPAFQNLEIHEKSERDKEQLKLANQLVRHKISVCAVDPGAGKTSIALMWHSLNQNQHHRPLLVTLPKQIQVTGLFKTIKNDYHRIFNDDNFSMEGFFNGKRQLEHNTNHGKLNSNVNIMVFDRFLSPSYERIQFDEFVYSLNCDLVIDEFHEFAWLFTMLEPLRELLQIRKWINNGAKTLLLSGTPDPSLIKHLFGDDVHIFKRDQLSSVNSSKTKVIYSPEDFNASEEDSLYSFNTIKDSQNFLKNCDINNTFLIHSKFKLTDKQENLEKILKEHGANPSKKITVTAKILQSSFNLNFKNGFLKLSHPSTDSQTWGRINRFDNKGGGTIIISKENDMSIFNENKLGYKKLIDKWESHLKIKIETVKEYTLREMLENLYDSFWTAEIITENLKYLQVKTKEAHQDLVRWYPIRSHFSNTNNANASTKSSKGFRGRSYYLSSAVYDNNGNPVGQLYGEDLLTTSSKWEINELKLATTNCVRNCISVLKEINEFNFNRKQTFFGHLAGRPLLSSYFKDNAKIELQKALKENGLYRVYNANLGLVDIDTYCSLIDVLKKKTT